MCSIAADVVSDSGYVVVAAVADGVADAVSLAVAVVIAVASTEMACVLRLLQVPNSLEGKLLQVPNSLEGKSICICLGAAVTSID